MVLLQLTPALRDRLDALAPRLPLELRDRVASHLAVEGDTGAGKEGARAVMDSESVVHGGAGEQPRTIPHELLVETSTWARGRDDLDDRDDFRLASLLRLTDVHAPPPPPRVKSPELLAILSSIQLTQDRAAYASLTSLRPAPHPSLVPLHDPYDSSALGSAAKSPAEEWREIRRELSAIVNVGASMAAVGTAVWWVSFGYSYVERILLSLAGAIAIAAIEAFLYYRFFTHLSREEAAAPKRAGAAGAKRRALQGAPGRAGAAGTRRIGTASVKGTKLE
ncbi:hypothetical protein JCM10449v2_005391 [Rhodotorula kratochvilovae]